MLSGVLQGCPLSGTLFLFAVNPFIRDMEVSITRVHRGLVRVCADDIGVVVWHRDGWRHIGRIFRLAEKFGALVLKFRKCVAVPLWGELSPEVRTKMTELLVFACPSWSAFAIASQTVYLGCLIGPSVVPGDAWTAPFAKALDRASALGARGAPQSTSLEVYRSRVQTVLSYKMQLFPLSSRESQIERRLLARVFRVPFSMLRRSDWFQIASFGCPQPISMYALGLASLMRAALVTCSTWQCNIARIRTALREEGRFGWWRGVAGGVGILAPPFWMAPSIASVLEDAALGFPSSQRLRAGGAEALALFRAPPPPTPAEARRRPRWQSRFLEVFQRALFSPPPSQAALCSEGS